MIKRLSLRNFKCFESLNLEFSGLNILTGLNGTGKSTILQSILLLAQSADAIENTHTIRLNERFQELGVRSDILYENAETDDIEISYEISENCYSYRMHGQENDEILMLEDSSAKRPFTNCNVIYLSAYRIAPQLLYKVSDDNRLRIRNFDKNGENTIQYLAKYQNSEVKNPAIVRVADGKAEPSLGKQAEHWMNLVSPGVRPEIIVNDSARTAELRFSYRKGQEITNAYKNTNVGFGITYVLPIIVTLLTASAGDLILIENPEAHIHPKGQRMLGEMIAAASMSGAQIIVETHSDHILNGIRLAVKKRIISCEAVNLYYFYVDTSSEASEKLYTHQVRNPLIDEDGMLSEWPEGFFDEWDIALTELLMP